MANVTHSTITDPYIHEPKGVAEASSGEVYRADGAGSGSWEAPLKLIERRALSGLTAEEFTGLSGYRSLWLIIEGWTWSSTGTIPIIQFSTASTYRTSGYLTTNLNQVTDTTNPTQAGVPISASLTYGSGFGNVQIMNLNSSTHPTSAQVEYVETNINLINSATAPSVVQYNNIGIYPTVEAHEKIKITTTGGSATCNSGYLTLYGI